MIEEFVTDYKKLKKENEELKAMVISLAEQLEEDEPTFRVEIEQEDGSIDIAVLNMDDLLELTIKLAERNKELKAENEDLKCKSNFKTDYINQLRLDLVEISDRLDELLYT